jgi:hypothetical protein
MADINDLEKSFNDLQEYSDNQFRTINSLKKEMEKLKEENKSLKVMLEGNTPAISFSEIGGFGISNEQLVCETQIAILKDRAITRELTYEEAKKFAIFTEVLEGIKKNNAKTQDYSVEKMPIEELLKIAEGTLDDQAAQN